MGLLRDKPNPGSLAVINESFTPKSRVTDTKWEYARPERPFDEQMYLITHDPRLNLSLETYVQMLMGSGFKVKIQKNPEAEKAWNKWAFEIDFDEKLENGMYSYVGVGNMIMEKAKSMADIIEVDITSIDRIERTDKGKITKYIQNANHQESELSPDILIHFKFTEVAREIWGRGMYHSVIMDRWIDDKTGYDSMVETMWKIEDAMKKIFESYASPIMMIHFEDAGEQFIKIQKEEFKNAKPGAKILTDKKFDVKVFEVNPASKFDKYIEHLQNDVLEPGVQFPIQFFNAGYTARASSQTTDDAVMRKVRRIQKRLANQLKKFVVIPLLESLKIKVDPTDVETMFEYESKSDLGIIEIIDLYLKGGIARDELRKSLKKNTTLDLEAKYDGDRPPITSVTPTSNYSIQYKGVKNKEQPKTDDDEEDDDGQSVKK